MKRILITAAIAIAVILPGFSLMGTPSAAADSCWLSSTSLGTSGSYIIGQGVTQCATEAYRTLRVCIVQDYVTRACGTTYGNAKVLWSSPSCQIQYNGPYVSFVRVTLTNAAGYQWFWQGPTKYLPRC